MAAGVAPRALLILPLAWLASMGPAVAHEPPPLPMPPLLDASPAPAAPPPGAPSVVAPPSVAPPPVAPSAGAPAAPLRRYPVHLRTEGPPLQISELPGDGGYLCTTPCTLQLPTGGLSLHADAPGRLLTLVNLDVRPPGQEVVLRSASAARVVGGVLLLVFGGVLTAGGAGLTIAGAVASPPAEGEVGPLRFGVGLTAVGVAVLTGGGLLMRDQRWGIERVTLSRTAP